MAAREDQRRSPDRRLFSQRPVCVKPIYRGDQLGARLNIGAIATWVQDQGPLVKAATIAVILILAALAVAFVLKTPDKSQTLRDPVSPSVVSASGGDKPSPASAAVEKPLTHRDARPPDSDQPETQKIEVKSENQSGGVTAGQIGNLNINSGN